MPKYCGLGDSICGSVTPEITCKIPSIGLIEITPNPVNQNTLFTIEVTATEIEVEILAIPIILYCGAFNCGQEILI